MTLSAQKGLKGSLTALGTAAVLGIYSAGYALTDEAAQRLEEPFGALSEPILPPDIQVEQGVTTAAPPEDSIDPLAASSEIAAPPEGPPDSAAAEAPTPSPAPSPNGPAEPPASPPSPPSAAVTAEAAVPTADTTAVDSAVESPYRDGTYTSRGRRTGHGDIEARVEIADGKIVSATVASCGMLWPCSDINRIIPRVVARQSTAIGIVSGATQSSEAFITAVDAALRLAMNSTP